MASQAFINLCELYNIYNNLNFGKGFKKIVAIPRYEDTLFVSDSPSVTSESPDYQFHEVCMTSDFWPQKLVSRSM